MVLETCQGIPVVSQEQTGHGVLPEHVMKLVPPRFGRFLASEATLTMELVVPVENNVDLG